MSFSNFVSNFGNSMQYDIMSMASDPIEVTVTNAYQYVYKARYMCIGNLLIQFSDAGTSTGTTEFNIGNGSITFPIAYDTTPYMVSVGTLNSTDIILNLINWTESVVNFVISNIPDQHPDVTFMAIGPIPTSLQYGYSISSQTNVNVTQYLGNGYNVIIVENANPAGGDSGSVVLSFTNVVNNVNMLVVGGGGGGGYGLDGFAGTGGGGGSSYYTGLSTGTNMINNSTVTITVGTGGVGGTSSTSPNFNGDNGGSSSITFTNTDSTTITLTANGGTGGNSDGGNGGNGGSTNFVSNYANFGSGGGGGGGGGTTTSASKNIYGGDGGTNGNTTSPNNNGGNGATSYASSNGGIGGNSYIYSNNNCGILLPFYSNNYQPTYIGGGGGGGSYSGDNGNICGGEGQGKGGSINNNVSGANGISATNVLPTSNAPGYFGGGGGGGGYFSDGSSTTNGKGGSGGNGVVILWWLM